MSKPTLKELLLAWASATEDNGQLVRALGSSDDTGELTLGDELVSDLLHELEGSVWVRRFSEHRDGNPGHALRLAVLVFMLIDAPTLRQLLATRLSLMKRAREDRTRTDWRESRE